MGILKRDLPVIIESIRNGRVYKKLLMLGNQKIYFDKTYLISTAKRLNYKLHIIEEPPKNETTDLSSIDLWKILGFQEIHIMDVSGYENADIIFDLNNNDCPSSLIESFDYICDGGTLEHVFDIKTALGNISKMLKNDGCIYHCTPISVDHGFHSISPTLYIDYYNCNNFDIGSVKLGYTKSDLFCYSADTRYFKSRYEIKQHTQQMMGLGFTINVFCYAYKREESTYGKIPIQSYYELVYQNAKIDKVENKKDVIAALINHIQKCEENSIVLYGTGEAFEHIMIEVFRKDIENRISALLDRDEKLIGTMIRGKKVECMEHINQNHKIKYVIIAVYAAEINEIIYERIKNIVRADINIIKLSEICNEKRT
jgi:hypothetical protein